MVEEFKTIKDIINYVKPLIDQYRQFPSKKNEIQDKLEIIYNTKSEYLSISVKDGRFAETFFRDMGKGRMKALKKLLLGIDIIYYSQIDFREE